MAFVARTVRAGFTQVSTVAVLLLMAAPIAPSARSVDEGLSLPAPGTDQTARQRALAAFEAQPLSFERNAGQQPVEFYYLATGQGYRV